MKAKGSQSGVNPQIGRNCNGANVARVECDFGVPIEKSGSEEELPPQASKGLREKCLTGLLQWQLRLCTAENPGAVNVVIQIPVRVARRDLVPVLLKKELPAQGKAAAAVVGVE